MTNKDYTILNPIESDAEQLLEFLKIVGGETDNLSFGSDGVGFSITEEKEFIKNHKGIWYIAKVGDEIIASSGAFELSAKKRQMHILDFGIAIKQKYHGIGIGSKLMDKIIIEAKQKGYKKIQLQCRGDNSKAISLYLKKGFEIEGKNRMGLKIGDEYIDEYYMGLIL